MRLALLFAVAFLSCCGAALVAGYTPRSQCESWFRIPRARRRTSSAARSPSGCRRRSASPSWWRTAAAPAAISAPRRWRRPATRHTLLVGGNGPVAINKHLYKQLAYDPDRDLAPISLLASAPQMLVVKSGSQGRGLQGLRRARAARARAASPTPRSAAAAPPHLTMELLKSEAELALVHVPYRGFPQAVDRHAGGKHRRDVRHRPCRAAPYQGGQDESPRRHWRSSAARSRPTSRASPS